MLICVIMDNHYVTNDSAYAQPSEGNELIACKTTQSMTYFQVNTQAHTSEA